MPNFTRSRRGFGTYKPGPWSLDDGAHPQRLGLVFWQPIYDGGVNPNQLGVVVVGNGTPVIGTAMRGQADWKHQYVINGDGSNASQTYLQTKGVSNLPNFQAGITISAWIKFNSLTNRQCIVSVFGGGAGIEMNLNATNDTFRVVSSSGATIYDSQFKPLVNTWYHVLFILSTATSAGCLAYINGRAQGGAGGTGAAGPPNVVPDQVMIGSYGGPDPQFDALNGQVSDVRVYNWIVTPSLIWDIYQNPYAALLPGPPNLALFGPGATVFSMGVPCYIAGGDGSISVNARTPLLTVGNDATNNNTPQYVSGSFGTETISQSVGGSPPQTRERKGFGKYKPVSSPDIDFSDTITKGLVGCWLLNECGGKPLDLASLQRVTSKGTATSWKASPLGVIAPNFTNTVNDFFRCPDVVSQRLVGAMSIVAGVYKRGNGGGSGGRVISRMTVAGSYYLQGSGASQLAFQNGSGGVFTAVNTFPNGFIGNVAATQNGTVGSIYLKGKLTATGTVGIGTNAAGAPSIGANNTTTTPWDGHIAYVYLYNRALQPSEITQLNENPYRIFFQNPRRTYFQNKFTQLTNNVPLYLTSYAATGVANVPLYTQADVSTSSGIGSVPLYTLANDNLNANVPLYQAGSDNANGNIPLVIPPFDAANTSIPLYTSGPSTTNTGSGVTPLVTAGSDSISNSPPLYLLPNAFNTSAIPLSVAGNLASNSGTPLYVPAAAFSSNIIPLVVLGNSFATSFTPLYTLGNALNSITVPLTMLGNASYSSGIPLYLPAAALNTSGTTLYTISTSSLTGNVPAFVWGASPLNTPVPLFVGGNLASSLFAPLYTQGPSASSSGITLYTLGASLQASGTPLYLQSPTLTSSGAPLYTAGPGAQLLTSNVPLYTAGPSAINNAVPLFAFSDSSATGNIPTFIQGSLAVAANIPLYMSPAVTFASGIPLYMPGAASLTSQAPLYVMSASSITGTPPLFMAGNSIINAFTPLFLTAGASSLSMNVPLFVSGPLTQNNNVPLFVTANLASSSGVPLLLVGNSLLNSVTPAFIYGNNASNYGVPLYVPGAATQVATQPAFIQGALSQATAVPLFLSQSAAINTNAPLFLLGPQLQDGSFPLYMSTLDQRQIKMVFKFVCYIKQKDVKTLKI